MENTDIYINAKDVRGRINPEIYGSFSEHLGRCIYNGIYVGEASPIPNTRGIRNDIVKALKNIRLPVMRWPGGCFADEYHWKDGVGDKTERVKTVNNWGQIVEDNSFGTHEFFDLCEQVGCEPYITGNLGSGTVRELMDWIDYITFDGASPMAELRRRNGREKPWKLKYLGIGNESWGCGGNMSAEYYCGQYRQYAAFCREFSGNKLFRIACGPDSYDYDWTEVCMKKITPRNMQGLSLHYYTVPTGNWNHKGSAVEFDDKEYYDTLRSTWRMEELVTRHSEIMNRYDPERKVGLIVDEWGCWYDVEPGTDPSFLYQKSTMRDAVVAAINLNIFNNHSERVYMANIAQTVNVLQAVMLTEGAGMVLTPTYHVLYMYRDHQGADSVYCYTDTPVAGDKIPMVSASASVKDDVMTLTLANCSVSDDTEVNIDIAGYEAGEIGAELLNAPVRELNDFDDPYRVTVREFDDVSLYEGNVSATLPACSVAKITLKK